MNISYHFTAQYVISRSRNSRFQKFINPDSSFNSFQNWFQNPGFSKLPIFSILPPGLFNYKSFSQENNLDIWILILKILSQNFLQKDFKSLYKIYVFSLSIFLPWKTSFFQILENKQSFISYYKNTKKKEVISSAFYFQINGAGPAFELASYSDSQVSFLFSSGTHPRSHQFCKFFFLIS